LAAGSGAKVSTWIESSGDCRRSTASWAFTVHRHLEEELKRPVTFNFTGCYGARVPDVTELQLPAIGSSTRWITLVVAGNDVDWGRAIKECVTWRTTAKASMASRTDACHADDTSDACKAEAVAAGESQELAQKFNCTEDVIARQAKLPALKVALIALYKEIKHRAPQAQVLVTGVPYLASMPYGSFLGIGGWLNWDEVNALTDGVNLANKFIQKACEEAGVTFVPVSQEFVGRSCGGHPELVNCLVFNTIPRSFHPTEAGSAVFAKEVLQYIDMSHGVTTAAAGARQEL
jgi:GDSL-like Lipase/Acylhydrolase family